MSKPRTSAPSSIIPHPIRDYADKIRLTQYRRGADNPTYEGSFLLDGAWSNWTSLGTSDQITAIANSITKLRDREAGIVPARRTRREVNTVNEIAIVTLARLEQERQQILATQPRKKAAKVATKIGRLKNVILPAIGERGIASLTAEDMERFRRGHAVKGGNKPKRGTIAQLGSGWLEILRDAQALGHLTKVSAKALTISQEGFAKGQRGSAFSVEEMQRLRTYVSDSWVAAGHWSKVQETRYLLRAMVSLMASTGLTPGLEVESLTPAQIEFRADSNGRPGLRVAVRKNQGKRAPDRIVWARAHHVWPVAQDMKALLAWIAANATPEYRQNNPRGFLFARPSDGLLPFFAEAFAKVLTALGMRRDPVTGGFRSLYSCRHFYASEALMDAMPIAMLAENLGNSEAMIRQHYAHILVDLRSGQLTGSGRPGAWLEHAGLEDRDDDDWHTRS